MIVPVLARGFFILCASIPAILRACAVSNALAAPSPTPAPSPPRLTSLPGSPPGAQDYPFTLLMIRSPSPRMETDVGSGFAVVSGASGSAPLNWLGCPASLSGPPRPEGARSGHPSAECTVRWAHAASALQGVVALLVWAEITHRPGLPGLMRRGGVLLREEPGWQWGESDPKESLA